MTVAISAQISDAVEFHMRATMAETVMPLWKNLRAEDMREKNPDDWVTAADIAAEKRLTPILKKLIPEAVVIGEEACSDNPSIKVSGNSGLTWTLDPVDGTRAFRNGHDDFGMLIGLMEDGYPIAGWLLSASGRMVSACNGIVTNEIAPHRRETIEGRWGNSRGKPNINLSETSKSLIARGHLVSNSIYSVNEYMKLADRVTDYNILAHDEVWDHVPGLAVAVALGGSIMDLHGNKWNAAQQLGTFVCMKRGVEEVVLDCLQNSVKNQK